MNESKTITFYNKVKNVKLPDYLYSKILEFQDRKINIKDFEKWIYSCHEFGNTLSGGVILKSQFLLGLI